MQNFSAECGSGCSAGVSFSISIEAEPWPWTLDWMSAWPCICMSSHVHVCGAYICLPEAGVLNSLSMCDESSGWEKSSALHGLSWPLTNWILKRLSICQGLNSYFALPLSRYLIYLALCLPLCVHCICLCIFSFISRSFWIDVMQNVGERCSKRVRQIKKGRASPTRTSFILIRSLCPRKGLLFTCLP